MKYTDKNKVCLFSVLTPWFCSYWCGNHVEFFFHVHACMHDFIDWWSSRQLRSF